jgi:hypothetical protein
VKPILADLGLVTQGDEHSWAVTSPDNQYRYVLGRMWDSYFDDGRDWWDRDPIRALWVFGMLNPSKARHDLDDPTVRKCIGFAKRGGAGGFLVVNLFAFSATDPRDLVTAAKAGTDICGEHNETALAWAVSRPALLGLNIAAWGRVPARLRVLAQRPRGQFTSRGCHCLGVNSDGSPRHPLMLAYSTQMERMRG